MLNCVRTTKVEKIDASVLYRRSFLSGRVIDSPHSLHIISSRCTWAYSLSYMPGAPSSAYDGGDAPQDTPIIRTVMLDAHDGAWRGSVLRTPTICGSSPARPAAWPSPGSPWHSAHDSQTDTNTRWNEHVTHPTRLRRSLGLIIPLPPTGLACSPPHSTDLLELRGLVGEVGELLPALVHQLRRLGHDARHLAHPALARRLLIGCGSRHTAQAGQRKREGCGGQLHGKDKEKGKHMPHATPQIRPPPTMGLLPHLCRRP